jgi:hypothetical protein
MDALSQAFKNPLSLLTAVSTMAGSGLRDNNNMLGSNGDEENSVEGEGRRDDDLAAEFSDDDPIRKLSTVSAFSDVFIKEEEEPPIGDWIKTEEGADQRSLGGGDQRSLGGADQRSLGGADQRSLGGGDQRSLGVLPSTHQREVLGSENDNPRKESCGSTGDESPKLRVVLEEDETPENPLKHISQPQQISAAGE